MKKLALAAVLSVAATTAFAGNLEEPVVEPVIVEEDTAGTGAGWIVLIMLAALAAVAAAG